MMILTQQPPGDVNISLLNEQLASEFAADYHTSYWGHINGDLTAPMIVTLMVADTTVNAASRMATVIATHNPAGTSASQAAEAQALADKSALQAAQADAAVIDINNMLAALQPSPFGALTTAQKIELVRTTLISMLQYERTIIKWAKTTISG